MKNTTFLPNLELSIISMIFCNNHTSETNDEAIEEEIDENTDISE